MAKTSTEKLKKIHPEIPSNLHKNLKLRAVQRGITLEYLVVELLKKGMGEINKVERDIAEIKEIVLKLAG